MYFSGRITPSFHYAPRFGQQSGKGTGDSPLVFVAVNGGPVLPPTSIADQFHKYEAIVQAVTTLSDDQKERLQKLMRGRVLRHRQISNWNRETQSDQVVRHVLELGKGDKASFQGTYFEDGTCSRYLTASGSSLADAVLDLLRQEENGRITSG